ncbi:hypothetical protein ONZ51_g10337 [Trametes cubensis]|uniref:F-box domain-containing protein n=1 Tax=Trametes cubensis TaxID=1111947 RepID=A0AAD7TJN8_9APHY|nr:hypothetical protein ONZ51_g10337 [Trametes cubensis]
MEYTPGMSHTGPALSYDVLLEVAAFASRQTLSSFMKTCRILYHEIAKMMLRRRVVIDNVYDMNAFTAFLNAEPNRPGFLCDLTIDMEPHPPVRLQPIAPGLSDTFLRHSFRSLTSLRLDHAEETLRLYPKLSDGLASLSTLTSLIVSPAGSFVMTMLLCLQADLRTLVIGYQEGLDQMEALPHHVLHPVVLLQRFRHSLETVEIRGYEVELSRAKVPGQYPKVQEFILDSPDCPLLAPYIHAFPDVRNLCITTVFADALTPDILPRERATIDAFRRLNQLDQASFGAWTKLETVSGTVADVYLAGFSCAIEVLYLNVLTYDPFCMVHTILRDASISQLHLFIHNLEVLEDGGLPMVLRQLGDSSLEALFLYIRLCAQTECEEDQLILVDMAAIDRLLDSFSYLRIKKLDFRLCCDDAACKRGSHRPLAPGMLCGGQDILAFDGEAVAQRILSSIPTVQDVGVRFMCDRKEEARLHRTLPDEAQ